MMKRYFLIWASLVGAALTACSPGAEVGAPTQTPLPALDREAETHRVYASALDSWCSGGLVAVDPDSPAYVEDAASKGYEGLAEEFSRFNGGQPAGFERSTFDDYLREDGREPVALDPDYDYGRPVALMSESEFRELQDESGGPDRFFESFPDHCGYVTLSRVGFNPTGAQAMVYLSAFRAGDSCIGEYLLLDRQDNRWEVTSEAVYIVC